MKHMKVLTITLLIALLTSFKLKDDVFIWFPHEIGIIQTCDGQEVEILFEITTGSAKKIKIHSFTLDGYDFTIFKDGKEFTATDTLLLAKNKPISLKVKYKILSLKSPSAFNFKTSLARYSDNQIKLSYGQYLIKTKDIRAGKEQIINVTESCKDTIKVFFPYGGTVSSATLYNDSSQTKKEFKSLSYMIFEKGNSIAFTKADVGCYHVNFNSCHWGGEFWLIVK